MAREKMYVQCVMTQQHEDSEHRLVTWIPEEGAVLGYTMKLKPPYSNNFLPGRWTCSAIGEARLTERQVRERMDAARKYRKNTDI